MHIYEKRGTTLSSRSRSVPLSLPIAVHLRVEGDRPGNEVQPSNHQVDDNEGRIVDNSDLHIGILNAESK